MEILNTVCHMCEVVCGMRAYVDDGKLVKVEGIPNHVASDGGLCSKGKICSAAAKLNPADANQVINKLLSMYDNKDYYKNLPVGKTFQECYNVATVKPREEHLKVYESGMEKLEKEIGLTLL